MYVAKAICSRRWENSAPQQSIVYYRPNVPALIGGGGTLRRSTVARMSRRLRYRQRRFLGCEREMLLGHQQAKQIALAHNADDPSVVQHRHATDTAVEEQLGNYEDRHLGRHRHHVARHDVADRQVADL